MYKEMMIMKLASQLASLFNSMDKLDKKTLQENWNWALRCSLRAMATGVIFLAHKEKTNKSKTEAVESAPANGDAVFLEFVLDGARQRLEG